MRRVLAVVLVLAAIGGADWMTAGFLSPALAQEPVGVLVRAALPRTVGTQK
jgi:hypothetical protein